MVHLLEIYTSLKTENRFKKTPTNKSKVKASTTKALPLLLLAFLKQDYGLFFVCLLWSALKLSFTLTLCP